VSVTLHDLFFRKHILCIGRTEEGIEMAQGTTNEAIMQQPKNQQKKHKRLAKEAVKSKN
jgi:hypothetical protein